MILKRIHIYFNMLETPLPLTVSNLTYSKNKFVDFINEFELEKKAREQGMVTMVQDGLIKALAGVTSVKEVFRQAE